MGNRAYKTVLYITIMCNYYNNYKNVHVAKSNNSQSKSWVLYYINIFNYNIYKLPVLQNCSSDLPYLFSQTQIY